jgi:pantothenate kinase
VILQGLYLLRDEQPWGDLDDIFDDKWLLRADVDAAMGNVVARQVNMGACEVDVRRRVDANDRVNAMEVYSMCRRPDFVIAVSAAVQAEAGAQADAGAHSRVQRSQ